MEKFKGLLFQIAHEAHMMGRIYNKLGEKETPAQVVDDLENMIYRQVKAFEQEVEDWPPGWDEPKLS
jgi:hypothetical protein